MSSHLDFFKIQIWSPRDLKRMNLQCTFFNFLNIGILVGGKTQVQYLENCLTIHMSMYVYVCAYIYIYLAYPDFLCVSNILNNMCTTCMYIQVGPVYISVILRCIHICLCHVLYPGAHAHGMWNCSGIHISMYMLLLSC